MHGAIAEHFLAQARGCDELGSPLTAALCRLLAERLNDSSQFGARIAAWSGNPRSDALSLRACGALHALARSGRVPALSSAYPPAPFDAEGLWRGIEVALAAHDAELTVWLDSPPQTNEVGRSSFILGGALVAAQLTGLPLELFEIGSSAGLNLAFDEYRYDLGHGRRWGGEGAPLTVASDWRGDVPPLDAPLRVVGRQGCDIGPLDPASPTDANRLLAYVWADQSYRLQRLDAALKHAAAKGRTVEKADAADWLERQLAIGPTPGRCRFVFHSIVRQYIPASTNARIDAALGRAGAAATEAAPIAHLSVETDGVDPGAPMVLTLWPGRQVIPLGRTDYHGRWVEWDVKELQS